MNRSVFTRTISYGLISLSAIALCGCPPVTPARSRILQSQIDAGQYSIVQLGRMGRDLYIHNFTIDEGLGNGRDGAPPPNFSRLVGPDTTSCNSCHGQNNVIAGWGTNAANLLVVLDDPVNPTVTGSNERSALHEQGVGFIELLSIEMSRELRNTREFARILAGTSGFPVVSPLTAKGISFGSITANADGTFDTSAVEGCDPDLRIRPFHHKGHESTVRIFARSALERHPGIQSTDILLFKDPTRDPATWDEDEDGVVNEFTEGELTALTIYQITLPAPVETNTGYPKVEAGRVLMTSLGCTECHKPALILDDPTWQYTSAAAVITQIDLTDLALGTPRLVPDTEGRVQVKLWADLKRHDIGPQSHEPLDQPVDDTLPNWDGGTPGQHLTTPVPPIPKELMLTTELWGVGDTGPWWHDGSSPSIDDAIRRHGGEAQGAADAYTSGPQTDRDAVLAFLNQLRVGLVGEILVTGKEAPDPKNLPLNSVTQYWTVTP